MHESAGKIKKLLIANRGEIAVRIIRAAREMGIHTAAIYSDADRQSIHTQLAHEVHALGSPEPSESYLNINKILAIAKQNDIDAIHPGYGFLSENHLFAKAVEEAGIIFIGPHSSTIELMGDKLKAKKLAQQAGVPVIPGNDQPVRSMKKAYEIGATIGYPILIKASAGGGGKGMRIVENDEELAENYHMAKNEARDAFGNDAVFFEKFITEPRHIEVQILADLYDHCIHLFERDCSIQRRHQKLIEESPSPFVSQDLRNRLTSAALKLAEKCRYRNAGTVEFVVDPEENFYFLEMNTRLQVEHPVTEYVTGIDLVKEQIRIAAGEPIRLKQTEIEQKGHAIEIRIYAEDPDNDFLPISGKINPYRCPKGNGIRIDDGYEENSDIPVYYDALISKLIVAGSDRTEALNKLKQALDECQIGPMPTTLNFGRWLIRQEKFINGHYDTGFIKKSFNSTDVITHNSDELKIAAALSALLVNQDPAYHKKAPGNTNKSKSWKKRRL